MIEDNDIFSLTDHLFFFFLNICSSTASLSQFNSLLAMAAASPILAVPFISRYFSTSIGARYASCKVDSHF